MTIRFTDVYDIDNITLTYNVFRGSTRIGSYKYNSYYWEKRKSYTVTDTGVKSGQTVGYRIEVTDDRNTVKSSTATVKVQ